MQLQNLYGLWAWLGLERYRQKYIRGVLKEFDCIVSTVCMALYPT